MAYTDNEKNVNVDSCGVIVGKLLTAMALHAANGAAYTLYLANLSAARDALDALMTQVTTDGSD